jgi:hypothetical protein
MSKLLQMVVAFCVGWLTGKIVKCFIERRHIYSVADVINVMDDDRWMTIPDIACAMILLKGVVCHRSKWPNMVWLIDTVQGLIGDGIIEQQEGTDEEIKRRYEIDSYPEYRLTRNGRRRRHAPLEKEDKKSNVRYGTLVPA